MYDIVPLQPYNFKHTAYQKDTDHIANRRSTVIFRGCEVGSGDRTYGKRIHTTPFFKNIGARYKRIRLRPQGSPGPQCYEYKKEKLKELKVLSNEGHIDLFFGDESHVCTQGYVPYGWQFKDEDVFVPAQKAARLNLFGFISRNNEYHGFTAQENTCRIWMSFPKA